MRSVQETPAGSEPLFECASEYDALLQQGTRLSGEDRHFFIRGRVRDLRAHLPPAFSPVRILDFGCGVGDTSRHLAEMFPGADVVGVDNAGTALAWAREHHTGARVSFKSIERLADQGGFDLCYVSCVLHHVVPERRPAVVREIRAALRPGGLLALFENNPWNPGTRMVMRRIPFDRDAIPLSPPVAERLLAACDLCCLSRRSLFYFPKPLAFARPLEPLLARIPLGAQYWVLAAKPRRAPERAPGP
jgi:SAM-dependent methyltransferase